MNPPDHTSDAPLVEMKGIVKRFPGVVALDNVDFKLRGGEVHVLLGENGAGKGKVLIIGGTVGAQTVDEYIKQ